MALCPLPWASWQLGVLRLAAEKPRDLSVSCSCPSAPRVSHLQLVPRVSPAAPDHAWDAVHLRHRGLSLRPSPAPGGSL